MLRAFLCALFAELRRRARQQGSAPRGQCGLMIAAATGAAILGEWVEGAFLLTGGLLFLLQAAHLGRFNALYGALGSIVGFLLWHCLSSCVSVFGACFCAAQAESGKTPTIILKNTPSDDV